MSVCLCVYVSVCGSQALEIGFDQASPPMQIRMEPDKMVPSQAIGPTVLASTPFSEVTY